MERRRYLRLVTAALGGLAGCGGAHSAGEPSPASASPESAPGGSPTLGPQLPVPKNAFLFAGVKDSIPAITDPAFAPDWTGVELRPPLEKISPDFEFEFEPRLTDDDPVIGVEWAGAARAYPLAVLNWFEVVNDRIPNGGPGGEPLLVTYCPLCRTGVIAKRTVRGEPTMFGVSGLLYRDNLVLYDEATRSLWSQLRAQAIRGPMTGTRLTLRPSTLTEWGQWKRRHPDTVVLLPPPASETVTGRVVRDVSRSPYGNYENSTQLGVRPGRLGDDRLHPKALVIGVRSDDAARAYSLEAVREAGVVNDVVGDRPVVVASTGETLVAYDRRIGGRTRTFRRAGSTHLVAAGSRWSIRTGRAVDGPHRGRQLAPATPFSAMFWFAWLQFNPETELWSPDG